MLQIQQFFGVPAQDERLFLVRKGAALDAFDLLLVLRPRAVRAEEDALRAENAHELRKFLLGKLFDAAFLGVIVEVGDVAEGEGSVEEELGIGEPVFDFLPKLPAAEMRDDELLGFDGFVETSSSA